MKDVMGWAVSTAVIIAATAASAQVLPSYEIGRSPYTAVSDFRGPDYGGPVYRERYSEPPAYGPPRFAPPVLPPPAVYDIVRENGFSPLGIPQQRGVVYIISVINRDGDDGRLVIDARSGRIIRFTPAYRMGDNFNDDLTMTYGPVGSLPPADVRRTPGMPPATGPRLASREPALTPPQQVPNVVATPKPVASKPAPLSASSQRSASNPARAAEARAALPVAPLAAAKSVGPVIQTTQDMPAAQGLD